MSRSFALKGHICHTPDAEHLVIRENAYAVCEEGTCKGVFDETIHLEPCICVDNSLQEGIRVAALLRSVESAEPIEQPEAKTEGEKPNPEPPRKKGGRKPKASDGQMVFVFKEDDLGIFSAKDPTKYFGENLDLPTYSRLNL